MKNFKKVIAVLFCFSLLFTAVPMQDAKAANAYKIIEEGTYRILQYGTNNCITAPLPVGELGEALYMNQREVGFQKQEFNITFKDPANPQAGYIMSPVGDPSVAVKAYVTMYGQHGYYLKPLTDSTDFIIQFTEGSQDGTVKIGHISARFEVKTNDGRQVITGSTGSDDSNQLFVLEKIN